jgi:phosphatidylinositol 4-kinase
VLDGIEFYLPQLAHMIIHLEVEWDDAILERFALVIAQQSIHFALQLNWILQGALQDYQPENASDGSPNAKYNPLFYTRCLKLLKNVERCVVYGKPRAQELQRLYEEGEISKGEMELLDQADRRFNALQITTKGAEDFEQMEGVLDGWLGVQLPRYKTGGGSNGNGGGNSHKTNGVFDFVQRFCVLDRHVLNLYTAKKNCCAGGGGGEMKLDRAMSLEKAAVHAGPAGSLIVCVERPDYEFRLRCSSAEDQTLWLRRLQEEAHTGALFQSEDENLRKDLTPAQLDRYDLFQNERQFVQAVTDLAETLRDKERDERKALAPVLMANLEIPETVYLPLCNSSDIWRRVVLALPHETRVFNTKARCPVIMHFISMRGEQMKKGLHNTDPNLDVAQFLHIYFDVTAAEVMEEVAEADDEGSDEVEVSPTKNGGVFIKTKDESMRASEHDSSYGGIWSEETDNVDEPQIPAPGGPNDSSRSKGNVRVQRLLRESFITLPSMISKRLGATRRRVSVMDRQTTMQPMVQIIDGRSEEADNASIGDGTVISVERSSVLVKDRILYGGLDEGDIDLESIDRAKRFVSNGESWAERSARMLEAAQKELEESPGVQLEIASCMSKSNDDLRQEVFVMQMIHYYKSVFAQAKLPLWLKTYRILSCSSSTGLLEVLVDATSLDGLKKSPEYPKEGGLRKYFEIVYGGPDSDAFKAAQTNFMQSLAAYALVSYLLGLKDRHNGNIMIDTRGHLIFIDFGFALGMAPGHEFSMERAPFKLTKEYVEVMGGVRSGCYKEFERLFVAGFAECRGNSQIALGLVEIMMFQSNYPCFSGWRYGKGSALTKLEHRLMLRVPDHRVQRRALHLIRKSRRHFGTHLYDVFQKATNGYAI